MSTSPPDDRTEHRADELLPEERTAGSDDPYGQAAAVLADSDERSATRGGVDAGGTGEDREPEVADVEHRRSADTVEPQSP